MLLAKFGGLITVELWLLYLAILAVALDVSHPHPEQHNSVDQSQTALFKPTTATHDCSPCPSAETGHCTVLNPNSDCDMSPASSAASTNLEPVRYPSFVLQPSSSFVGGPRPDCSNKLQIRGQAEADTHVTTQPAKANPAGKPTASALGYKRADGDLVNVDDGPGHDASDAKKGGHGDGDGDGGGRPIRGGGGSHQNAARRVASNPLSSLAILVKTFIGFSW